MDDRIEREIVIDAPLERVWNLVTVPGWWVPTEAEDPVDHTPGHRTVRKSAKWGAFTVEVVKVDPRTYAAFRWASQFPNEELAPGKTTLVEFFVKPLADSVSVTVVESGFASLEADETIRMAGFKDNTEGWALEMTSLKERAEGTAAA